MISRIPRPLQLTLVATAAIILLVVGGFGAARAFSAGQTLSVEAATVPLGGLTPEQAAARLEELEAQLTAEPVTVMVEGQELSLDPNRVGFSLDIETMTDQAMSQGRTGSVGTQLSWWLQHLFDAEEIPLSGSLDPDALEAVLEGWNESVIDDPPFPGAVEVEGTTPVAVYPEPGQQIDPDAAGDLLLTAILDGGTGPVELPVVSESPRLTRADVDRAVARAGLWLSAPVTLTSEDGEVSVTFDVADLAAGLRSQVEGDELVLSFDQSMVEQVLSTERDRLERPPEDARLEVDGYEVRVVPGRPGTRIDPAETTKELEEAASSAGRSGTLPFEEAAEPDVTTEELEALDINHLVSRFTTYHDCCQNRVTNIQLIADTIDGVIVEPGETFAINEYVGRRTLEKGYLPDGSIVGGELVDSVGGGISQFATTFYNAVFWGGYEDVTHKPHSFYFPRYPEGIESTISFPQPEVAFRNDSDAGVLIKTSYTDTSITVSFYGDNDGRILVGQHAGGSTSIEIVAEGGPDARIVEAEVSDRFDFREPDVEYRPNPDLDVDEQRQTQSPAVGWTVVVTRTITEGDETRTREWVVRYLPRREIIEVHPCKVPGSETTCPTTTTTTTTTTTVPSTTSTTTGTTTTTAPPSDDG